ncbi:hypothetical protein [Kribbella sp. CA-293567]|uniref:hypothetical protein n=1 Tax=Kribbella sp. CA-293567 TaxID=3002436 RepID=UPI0022DE2A75|nr:hypothetical protein [Kribbella sp. CA-293567]WBQ03824.1 hypothetical protein OX958_28120 [Kribbella sp. CA-293567]
MNRAEALALATKTVNEISPPANSRGYADGVAPLAARGELILRMAAFLCETTDTEGTTS